MRISLLTILLASTVSLSNANPPPFFEGTIEEALAASAKEDKVLIVDFYAGWCGPCRSLVKNSLGDTTVIEAIRKDFILYKLNVDDSTGQQWCKDYSVHNFPTMLFIKPGSKESLMRIEGFRPPQLLLGDLKHIQKGH